jgi:arsenate reductase|tara:strand:+ start:1330 stop:1749 length:420 start_codon:yes stop_codon:yes gene_type:complete
MNILFLCVGNSARSQIAEGLAKDMLPNSFDIRSAGSLPAENVHKHAILVMNDVGIDISKNTTKSIKSIDEKFINNLDYVITLCAQEVCPVVPEATKIFHWPNEDPDNDNFSDIQSKNAFIKTRESIFILLKKFLITESI